MTTHDLALAKVAATMGPRAANVHLEDGLPLRHAFPDSRSRDPYCVWEPERELSTIVLTAPSNRALTLKGDRRLVAPLGILTPEEKLE